MNNINRFVAFLGAGIQRVLVRWNMGVPLMCHVPLEGLTAGGFRDFFST